MHPFCFRIDGRKERKRSQYGKRTRAKDERAQWRFLGGFGSDYCSGDVDDADRNYLDRGEQIAIAVNRCREMLSDGKRKLKRVTHIGDAPADVLAAKSFSERCQEEGDDLCVGMVAVATGSYSANELQELIGERVEGTWEPVVMEDGMAADTGSFLRACGVL